MRARVWRPLLVPQLPDAPQDREHAVAVPGQDAQVAAQARDLEIEERLRHARVAAGARGPQAPPQDAVLRGRGPLARSASKRATLTSRSRLDPARAGQARAAASQLRRARCPSGLRHEEGQGHAQAPAGDPHLMQVFLAAGQRLGKASEDGLDPLLEQGATRSAVDGVTGKSPESHGG